jgi:hypothetical protein
MWLIDWLKPSSKQYFSHIQESRQCRFVKKKSYMYITGTMTPYSSVKSRSGHRSGAVETYKRPLEALHDSVSHALQPPKPTITACDIDNTATSVKKMTMITKKIVQLMKCLMQLKKWWFSRMERDIAWKYRCY